MSLKQREISTIEEKCKEGFPIHDGSFIRYLDDMLGQLNVHREAYYGGTFTGNNVHKRLNICRISSCNHVIA